MGRKYTKIVFSNDEGEIKKIISDIKPNLKYIDISYVRDDRVVNLETNEVAVGDNPWKEFVFNDNETMSIYRHGGDVAIDRLRNGTVDDEGKIIGKKVHLDLNKDGFLEFGIVTYTAIDFNSGYCNAPCSTPENLIEELRFFSGYENIIEEMNSILEYYKDYNAQQFFKFWFVIHKFNLFNQLDQYANLLTYVDEYRIKSDATDFWEAIKIPEQFRFCLNNYYLTNSNHGERFYLSKFQVDSELHKFYLGLPTDDCRDTFIECAEMERYTLRSIERTLSYRSSTILSQVEKSPSFFCDCLRKLNVISGQENIIERFSYYVTQLEKYDMAIEFSNIARLAALDKANHMGMEPAEFFDIIDKLDTKQGLIAYLRKEYQQ